MVEFYDVSQGRYFNVSELEISRAGWVRSTNQSQSAVAAPQTFSIPVDRLIERITKLREAEADRITAIEEMVKKITVESINIAAAATATGELDEEVNGRVSIDTYDGKISVRPTKEQLEELSKRRSVPQVVSIEQANADLEFLVLVSDREVKIDGSGRFTRYLPRMA